MSLVTLFCDLNHNDYICKMKHECKACIFNEKAAKVLSSSNFHLLEENHLVINFHKGDSIIKQGVYSTNVVFLRQGLVKIHIKGPYNEQIVRLVKAPTYLGLPTTIGEKINQYSITALSEVEVCFINIEVFETILKENTVFANEIILELCRNELDSFERCANRTQKQARGKIAAFLLEMSNHIFESDSFTLPLSQSEIGNLVDVGREGVSRVMSEYDKDGLISMKGRDVEILNKESLELISKNG